MQPGLTTGRQNTGKFRVLKFTIDQNFNFLLRLTKLQHYYSSSWYFWYKPGLSWLLKEQKVWKPYFPG